MPSDKAQQRIVETVAGTFRQLSPRLAWALTIHQSQGLTLDHVYIDLGRARFAHGQTLCRPVALPIACGFGTGDDAARRGYPVRHPVLGYRRACSMPSFDR